jgi:large subunit ribosomal protein L7e
VPTKDEIHVPETILKKRKSQEKERELRAAEAKKKREVRQIFLLITLDL